MQHVTRTLSAQQMPDALAHQERFAPLFAPHSIAVIGASASALTPGNRFIRHLQAFGYRGRILPVHPSAAEIEGLASYPSVAAIPNPVDYAYVAVAAKHVPDLLRDFDGRVRFAQVVSSGFGESASGAELERELLAAARQGRVRVIGPNCLGMYSPRARVTFTERLTHEAGAVGIVCQSGGLGIDIARRGQNRGLRFSGLVTVGNCADVKASELLEHFLDAADTKVIGLYLEGGPDGRRLFEVLRSAGGRKPVVILKGGRTDDGRRAASSHTGALAGTGPGWRALAQQTGAVLARHLDEFLDTLLALQCLALGDRPSTRVVLFGNGGGASVLGTDAFVEAGFAIRRLSVDTLNALESLHLPAGSSMSNPIDVPANALQKDRARGVEQIFDIVGAAGEADVLLTHVNMTALMSYRESDLLGEIIGAALRVRARAGADLKLALVLRSDGDPDAESRKYEERQKAVQAGIPVFDELHAAARALALLREAEAFRTRGRERATSGDARSGRSHAGLVA